MAETHTLSKNGRGYRCVSGCVRGIDTSIPHQFDDAARKPYDDHSYRRWARDLRVQIMRRIAALPPGKALEISFDDEETFTNFAGLTRIAKSAGRDAGKKVKAGKMDGQDSILVWIEEP